MEVKQPSWAEEVSPGCLLVVWKSYRGDAGASPRAGWEAAPCCSSRRQHPRAGAGGSTLQGGGLARVIRLLCSVLLITVPIQCSRIPLPPSQPEHRSYRWEWSNTKGSRCSVLILISNFTSTSSLTYWCFCPCAGAALAAECCCVCEGTASSRLQQNSVHKPEWLPPRHNKIGNTTLSTEPEWEVALELPRFCCRTPRASMASRVSPSMTAPGWSSKELWLPTHSIGSFCCILWDLGHLCPSSLYEMGMSTLLFLPHCWVSEQCHSSQ